MRASLVGSGGPVLGREYPLDAAVVTIGRRDENAIVIKDPTVSRKHAEIRRDGDGFVIVDKNSTSGILLNGEPVVGEQRLQDGDRLGIGMSAVFLVQLHTTEEATVTFTQPPLGDRGRTQFVPRSDLAAPRDIAAPPHVSLPRDGPFSPPPTAPPVVPLPVSPPGAPASAPPPTFSAAPPYPRLGADRPVAPSFTPPPPPPGVPPAVSQRAVPPMGAHTNSWPAAQSASASAIAPQRQSRRGLAIGLIVLLLIIVVLIAIVGMLVVRGGA